VWSKCWSFVFLVSRLVFQHKFILYQLQGCSTLVQILIDLRSFRRVSAFLEFRHPSNLALVRLSVSNTPPPLEISSCCADPNSNCTLLPAGSALHHLPFLLCVLAIAITISDEQFEAAQCTTLLPVHSQFYARYPS
jgi:hypothetical protein